MSQPRLSTQARPSPMSLLTWVTTSYAFPVMLMIFMLQLLAWAQRYTVTLKTHVTKHTHTPPTNTPITPPTYTYTHVTHTSLTRLACCSSSASFSMWGWNKWRNVVPKFRNKYCRKKGTNNNDHTSTFMYYFLFIGTLVHMYSCTRSGQFDNFDAFIYSLGPTIRAILAKSNSAKKIFFTNRLKWVAIYKS